MRTEALFLAAFAILATVIVTSGNAGAVGQDLRHSIDGTTVHFQWDVYEGSDFDHYMLRVTGPSVLTFTFDERETDAHDVVLLDGLDYTADLRVHTDDGYDTPSIDVFTVPNLPPPDPVIDELTALDSESVRIRWTQEQVHDLRFTFIHFSDIPEMMTPGKMFSPPVDVEMGTDLESITVTGLREGVTYIFLVSSEDDHGAFSISEQLSVHLPVTPPVVTVTQIPDGDDLAGTVSIRGTATDDQGIDLVRFRVNDGPWQKAVGYSNWAFFLDTTALEPGTNTVTVQASDGMASTETTFEAEIGGSSGTGSAVAPIPPLYYALLGLASFLAVLALSQSGIYLMFSAMGLMYAKVTGRRVLDNYVRGKIHGYIIANPGDHYSGIMRKLELKNGLFAYHVKVLEREKLVKSVADGRFRRFYPIGMKVEDRIDLDNFQLRVLNLISEHPGITQKDLGRALDARKQVVNRNVRAMFHEGLIDVIKEGRETHCYLMGPDDAVDVEEI